METWILSIGLNVGRAEPAAQLDETLAQVRSRFGPLRAVTMLRGEWAGIAERTVQLAVRADYAEVARSVPALCRGLRQDAIAVAWPEARAWINIGAAGVRQDGGSVEQFPLAFAPGVL